MCRYSEETSCDLAEAEAVLVLLHARHSKVVLSCLHLVPSLDPCSVESISRCSARGDECPSQSPLFRRRASRVTSATPTGNSGGDFTLSCYVHQWNPELLFLVQQKVRQPTQKRKCSNALENLIYVVSPVTKMDLCCKIRVFTRTSQTEVKRDRHKQSRFSFIFLTSSVFAD